MAAKRAKAVSEPSRSERRHVRVVGLGGGKGHTAMAAAEGRKDFFVSYTGADRRWAEWVAWVLEEAGHTVVLQAWDFHVGENFIANMHRALEETILTLAVLSPAYCASTYCQQGPRPSPRRGRTVRIVSCR